MPSNLGVLALSHVGFGVVAVLAGAVALAARKGHPTHVGAGRVFVATMGATSAVGAVLGLIKMETFYITFHAGVLGVTLILSGWLTARVRSGQATRGMAAMGVVNLLNAGGLILAGLRALEAPDGMLYGFAAADYFFLSGMAGLALIGDAALFIRRELPPRQRIARHVWRMGLGFFLAAGSAFTGPGAKAFPEPIQRSGVLSLPELIILVLTLFWFGHTLWWKRDGKREAP